MAEAEPAAAEGDAAQRAGGKNVAADVGRLKAVLDSPASETPEMLQALEELKALGSIPTKVLSDTLIGKTVNQLAKASLIDDVRNAAKALVDEWRQVHRKRKSSTNLAAEPGQKFAGVDAASAELESPAATKLPRTNSTMSDSVKSDLKLERNDSNNSLLTRSSTAQSQKLERADSLLSFGGEKRPTPPERSVSKPNVGAGEKLGASPPAANGGPELSAMEKHRGKVLQRLTEALGKMEEMETKGDAHVEDAAYRDPAALAQEIEEALAIAKPKQEEYLSQARSVLWNLKDAKNPTFRFKLMVGFFKPQDVPTLTAEDMASDEKKEERAALRKYAMEEIQSDWALKHGQQRITGMFTCGKCKGNKTTYFQMQTRSSDEPMTTFVTCLSCNNRWKFC